MTEHCSELDAQLAPYVDGELDAGEAEAFALHLAGCASCRAALHDALQIAALETRAQGGAPVREAAPRPARERVRRWTRRAKLATAGAALALVAALVIVIGARGGGPVAPAPAILAIAEVRSVEGRLSYAAADRYRRYSVVRAGGPATSRDAISLDTLARLEQRGDLHGVAAGYLLLGDPARATAYLERAPASPDVAADRGFVLLATGHPAEALIALDGVLDRAPRHPQALWNRALALRDLGLPRMAAAAFEAVAAVGEPGWSDEARDRARALDAETHDRATRSERLIAAGIRLATEPGGVSPDLARQIPGTARVLFDDAVRGAASPDAVRALAPLARALDAVAGTDARSAYLSRIASGDFRRRGPLAAQYAAVVADHPLAPDAARALVAALRATRQDDILFGALILTSPDGRTVPPDQLPELRRLADATGDPWYRMIAIEQQALALIARGDAAAVELRVLPALAGCTTNKLDLWCGRLELALGQSYLITQRLADARRVLGDGIARARRSGEWLLEQRFYPELANLEMLGDDVSLTTLPLARAYLGELVRRDARCTTDVWSREQLALALTVRLDIDAARHELAQADAIVARCPDARPLVRNVIVRAGVARDDEVAAVRAEIAELRSAPGTSPASQAVLDQTEGALLIERDRATAVALLEHAIARSRALDPADVEARKARSYAYATLVLDAGRAGDWTRVWHLLGEESGLALDRCGVGVATDARRSVAVLRDATGALAGSYAAIGPGAELDVAHLVPAAALDRLRGCPEIDVVARPPIEGSAALLPIELPWGYRSSAAADATPSTGPRLVIANVDPPAALGLPRLLPWRSAVAPDVALDGGAATPSRVLAALADAGTIEIHAHGMINPEVSDASFLMLSPDADGRYALTAAEIRNQRLRGHPVVILAACHAGAAALYRHELWGLPAAFLGAGARAVIASPDVIGDADAGEFFDAVRAKIERGSSPTRALHDGRLEWLAAHPQAAWVRSLMVFR